MDAAMIKNVNKLDTVYFAHPLTHYDEEIELECFDVIFTMLGECFIFNPNQKWLGELYNSRKENGHDNPFGIFNEIAGSCDKCVGSSFLDGTIGAGVAKEMLGCIEKGIPTYLIFISGESKFFFPVSSLDSYIIHSVEETRKRLKDNVR